MNEDIKSAPIFPIGNKTYFCVEYPGNVKNINRALETIGGEKSIAQFYESVKKSQGKDSHNYIQPIELRYRPNDPYSHPIEGNVVSTSRLLLKVTRRRKKDQPEEEAQVKTDILGVIPYTCRFRNMADFQYIVPKSNRLDQLRNAIVSGNVNKIMEYEPKLDDDNNDLESLPPPVFSTMNIPFKYDYKQNSDVVRVRLEQPDGSYVTKLVTRTARVPVLVTYATFEQDQIPKEPAYDLPHLDQNALAVKEKLLMLFEERPVWLRIGIRSQLTASERVHLQSVLPYVAYSFSNGPWRECWVRYGHEIRYDIKYNIYQQMDIRATTGAGEKYIRGQRKSVNLLNSSEQEKLNNDTDDTNSDVRYIFDGKAAVTATCLFQLCDITDPDFAGIINNPKYLNSIPTKRFGFYFESAFQKLRTGLKKKQMQLTERGYADPIENIEEGLDKKIKQEILRKQSKPNKLLKLESVDNADIDTIYNNNNNNNEDDDDDDDDDIVDNDEEDDKGMNEEGHQHMDWEKNV